MEFTNEQREFLKSFFLKNLVWIKEKEMLEPDDIKQFADLYLNYLENSDFRDSEILKCFYLELKSSQLHELKLKKGEVNLTLEERVFRMSIPATSSGLYRCKNKIIRKWYSKSLVVRKITQCDRNSVNKSIEPKIKQNVYERKLSFETARRVTIK